MNAAAREGRDLARQTSSDQTILLARTDRAVWSFAVLFVALIAAFALSWSQAVPTTVLHDLFTTTH
jgi:hypothetical protein